MHRCVPRALVLAFALAVPACGSPAHPAASADATAGDSATSDAPVDTAGDATATQDVADSGPADATATDAADSGPAVDATATDASPPDAGPADSGAGDAASVACLGPGDCAPGLVCQVAACGAPGKCQAPPGLCAPEPAWECGCDGQDYANSCDRLSKGVGLDHAGKCKTPGKVCDPAMQDACGAGEYCARKEGCDSKEPGVCTAIPATCSGSIGSPVCSCDGQEFTNACHAAAAGKNVAHEGTCEAPGKLCGGIAGFQCGIGMICDRQECYPDAAGFCAWVASTCPPAQPGQEECGCNGKTYASACERQLAGVGRKNAGVCAVP